MAIEAGIEGQAVVINNSLIGKELVISRIFLLSHLCLCLLFHSQPWDSWTALSTAATIMGSDPEKKGHQAADYQEQVEALRQQQEDDTFVYPSAAEERKVIRKLDWRLLPLVFVLYSLAVLDRSNLGNARLAGSKLIYHISRIVSKL